MHMVLLLALAQAAQAAPGTPTTPVPASEWPDFVRAASRAIAAKDPVAIAEFLDLTEIPADGAGAWRIQPRDVLIPLAGCRQSRVTRSGEASYVIHFSCPSRRPEGCATGSISVLVRKEAWKHTMAVAHDRKVSAACPLFAPPPLPPSHRPAG